MKLPYSYPKACDYVLDMLKFVYKADKEDRVQKMSAEERFKDHQEHSKDAVEKLGEWMKKNRLMKSRSRKMDL